MFAPRVTASPEITDNQRTPIEVTYEGHIYDSVIATNDARQANGDLGLENGGHSRRHTYRRPKAARNSRQVNGNLSKDVAIEFLRQ